MTNSMFMVTITMAQIRHTKIIIMVLTEIRVNIRSTCTNENVVTVIVL